MPYEEALGSLPDQHPEPVATGKSLRLRKLSQRPVSRSVIEVVNKTTQRHHVGRDCRSLSRMTAGRGIDYQVEFACIIDRAQRSGDN